MIKDLPVLSTMSACGRGRRKYRKGKARFYPKNKTML